jgi:hypothetical protein
MGGCKIENEKRLGFKNGLSIDQVREYIDKGFTWRQMRQIRLGLENGLTLEQVRAYAYRAFDEWQMWVLRSILEAGFNLEQIGVVARPWIGWSKMFEAYKLLLKENSQSAESVKMLVASWHTNCVID